MTLKLNLNETLQALRDANLTASARIIIDELLQEVNPADEFQIDLNEALRRNRLIAHTWCIDDVREVRPELDDDQAWEVLQMADRKIDSELGISWTTIEVIAEDLFPVADDSQTDSE